MGLDVAERADVVFSSPRSVAEIAKPHSNFILFFLPASGQGDKGTEVDPGFRTTG